LEEHNVEGFDGFQLYWFWKEPGEGFLFPLSVGSGKREGDIDEIYKVCNQTHVFFDASPSGRMRECPCGVI
jgi:hypothetical protein